MEKKEKKQQKGKMSLQSEEQLAGETGIKQCLEIGIYSLSRRYDLHVPVVKCTAHATTRQRGTLDKIREFVIKKKNEMALESDLEKG